MVMYAVIPMSAGTSYDYGVVMPMQMGHYSFTKACMVACGLTTNETLACIQVKKDERTHDLQLVGLFLGKSTE